MADRLRVSLSPYLRAHADNPVDWWPWCEEAFEQAKRRDVPVVLSVGYAACHWCHVMAARSGSGARLHRCRSGALSRFTTVRRWPPYDSDSRLSCITRAH
ncbi:MAG TPA: DUF255 domain-containing protein [Dermatophilaceae bacterium]|nr:DUF255 domain-containing protein [Dermatophilaceae bacterium]